jgi:molybdopterin-guanine dinucleotide biosynthesis protein A
VTGIDSGGRSPAWSSALGTSLGSRATRGTLLCGRNTPYGGKEPADGVDKASIVIAAGRTCAQTVADRLSFVAAPVIQVGPGRSGLTSVSDEATAAGPLAAMATGWKTLGEMGHSGAALVLACDLPEIAIPLLELLARFPTDSTVVPVVNGRAQPLCARDSAASMDACQHLVSEGRRSLKTFV